MSLSWPDMVLGTDIIIEITARLCAKGLGPFVMGALSSTDHEACATLYSKAIVVKYISAAPRCWHREDLNERRVRSFVKPRLQLIQITHHDLLRRRLRIEFVRIDLKAL